MTPTIARVVLAIGTKVVHHTVIVELDSFSFKVGVVNMAITALDIVAVVVMALVYFKKGDTMVHLQ